MKDKIKKIVLPVLLGIAIAVTAFLGWVFLKNIQTVNEDHTRVLQIMEWACTKDPASCRDANGNPLPTKKEEQAAAPTPTDTPPATTSTR